MVQVHKMSFHLAMGSLQFRFGLVSLPWNQTAPIPNYNVKPLYLDVHPIEYHMQIKCMNLWKCRGKNRECDSKTANLNLEKIIAILTIRIESMHVELKNIHVNNN